MKTALDTNIVSAIWSNEPSTPAVRSLLAASQQLGSIVISPVVYAELLAHPHMTPQEMNYFLGRTGIDLDFEMSAEIWTEAGYRYRDYAIRRRKSSEGHPRRILADFLIGAHALHTAGRLMTLDLGRYKVAFPELILCSI